MRKPCPFCCRKHLASARRTLWELEYHADDEEDPHLENLIGDLEHAEQQAPWAQIADRIRAIKLIFDKESIWCYADFAAWQEKHADQNLDRQLVSIMMELRELAIQERNRAGNLSPGSQ